MSGGFGGTPFGAMWAMWVPCVVFAHLFAAYFLARTFALVYPKAWHNISKRWRKRQPAQSDGGEAVHVNMVKLSSLTRVSSNPLTRKASVAVRQLRLEWSDLGCSYGSAGGSGTKVVLAGVSGRVLPGEMAALMGPSGAGKSTLMDILACRKTLGRLTGHVLVNGHPPNRKAFMRETAYIPQEDTFLPSMTVAETAAYYAALTLPRSWGAGRRQERVGAVLAALGLSHTTGTLVGGYLPGGLALRGLSGGERKRLSIATGILATPSIVFLDEPTSGLDSFAALKIMGHLRSMSRLGGPSIVASIHQPRAAIWSMFDSATLLSQGHLMYTGSRDGVVPWFEHLGYYYVPAMHGLPSDWIMDLVNINFDRPAEHYGAMFSTEAELESAAEAFAAYSRSRAEAEVYNEATPLQPVVLGADVARPPLTQRQLSGLMPAPKGSKVGGAAAAGPCTVIREDGAAGSCDQDGDVECHTPSSSSAYTSATSQVDGSPAGAHKQSPPRQRRQQQQQQQHGSDLDVACSAAPAAALRLHQQHQQQQRDLLEVVDQLEAAQHLAGVVPPSSSSSSAGGGQGQAPGGTGAGHHHVARRGSWVRQVRVLFWRELLAVTRNPADVAGRMLIFCWLGIFIGLIFYDMAPSIDGLRSRLNVLFVQPVIFLLLPYVYMSLFAADKQYFIADVSAKLYRPSAYYLAKQLAVAPFLVLNTLVFSFTLYGMAGLRHNALAVVGNGVISVLLYAIAAQVLSFAAILAPNQDMAFMGAISWTAVNMLMSNIMVRYTDMTNHWISYLRYLSAMGYAFAGYSQLEFTGLSVSCQTGLSDVVVDTLPRYLPTVSLLRSDFVINTLKRPGSDCEIQLSTITQYFGVTYTLWQVIVILLGYLLLVHLATFLGLLLLAKKERR